MRTSNTQQRRVIIQQPALPHYRVPVFRELNARNIADVAVWHGVFEIPNAPADGFRTRLVPIRHAQFLGRRVYWHAAHWQACSPKVADVAILNWNLHFATLLPSLLRAKRHGIPVILWGHGYSKNERRWRAAARTSVARLATALLVYNKNTAANYVRRGWDSQRVFVALNALDQSAIAEARHWWLARPQQLRDFRQTWGLACGPVVLFVSRLQPANRLDLLIAAGARLAKDFPQLRLALVGNGDAEKKRVIELARAAGIAERVIFPGAIYGERELAPWFLAADVFCYPANIGLSLLHAFGYGLPVITSDATALQNPEIEALRHGENGLLYRHNDVDALVEALRLLLTEAPLRAHMSAEALCTVREQFTLANMVDGMQAAIEYCLQRRP